MAKGGRESARPSYGRPKLTLISIEKITLGGVTKSWAVTILTLERNPPEKKLKVAVIAFLHLIDGNQTKKRYQNSNKKFALFTWSCFFLIWIFPFPRPSFTKPKSKLFFRDQIFRNRNFPQRPNSAKPKPRLFFPGPKFSETETETFFSRPNFPKPTLFSETKFSKTETETLQKLSSLKTEKFRNRNVNLCSQEEQISGKLA